MARKRRCLTRDEAIVEQSRVHDRSRLALRAIKLQFVDERHRLNEAHQLT